MTNNVDRLMLLFFFFFFFKYQPNYLKYTYLKSVFQCNGSMENFKNINLFPAVKNMFIVHVVFVVIV